MSDLRIVANRLFDHLDSLGERSIEVEEDYYWVIGENHLYDPTHPPTDFLLGQLSDDRCELKKVRDGAEPISYGLVWFGSILRVIGQKIVR